MNTKQEPSPALALATCSHLPAPERFEMGDKRRFHWRIYNERYEVYSIGLDQWAECNTPDHAKAVADALEAFYANKP